MQSRCAGVGKPLRSGRHGRSAPQNACFGTLQAHLCTHVLQQARTWAADFVHWYNFDHRHSGIRYVSPAQRHSGQDMQILQARNAVYTQARARNPARWSGKTRDWSHTPAVTLNPERESVVTMTLNTSNKQHQAA